MKDLSFVCTTLTRRVKDITGQKFHRLTVVSFAGITAQAKAYWNCQCDCGVIKQHRRCELIDGHVKSCGCLNLELVQDRKPNLKHGGKGTRTYSIWKGIRKRCNNPSELAYPNYGGRGIAICERWNDFRNFLSDMGECPECMSIDRKDNDGNYDPGNCRWATDIEQANNTRKNVRLTFMGRTQTLPQWCRELGVSYGMVKVRLSKGLNVEQALTDPVDPRRTKKQ